MDKITHKVRCERWTAIIKKSLPLHSHNNLYYYFYSTVTLFARLRGLSTSNPLATLM